MDPDGSPSRFTPHKNNQREARELVLRILFQIDVGKQPMDEVIDAALAQSVLEGSHRQFAEDLARSTWQQREELDRRLAEFTPEWTTARQAAVDRNILRMTTYEIFNRPDTPVAAVINEAVELAKKYSTAESGRFVNGVLGALARHAPRGQGTLEHGEREHGDPANSDLDGNDLDGSLSGKSEDAAGS